MLNVLFKGVVGRDRDDVGPLDAAAAADRPGDDDLPEVLHADRGGRCSWARRCGSTRCPNRQFFGLLQAPAAVRRRRALAFAGSRDRLEAEPRSGGAAMPIGLHICSESHATEMADHGSDLLAVVLLPALRGDRLRLRGGGGRQREHRADGVLPGAVAGGDGRACSSWPGPISSARCNC